MARIALSLFVLGLSTTALAQEVPLGDPIVMDGVEARGFTHGDHPSRVQTRHGIRISLGHRRAPHARSSVVRVCDAAAVRIETETPAAASVRVQIPGHGPSAHLITPERLRTTHVVIAIPRGERWVAIAWAVPTAQRSRWRALEDAFFASIRCVD